MDFLETTGGISGVRIPPVGWTLLLSIFIKRKNNPKYFAKTP
jgi:hypothetical protein